MKKIENLLYFPYIIIEARYYIREINKLYNINDRVK